MEAPARTLEQLAELLKRKYLENPHIERLFYPDNPLALEQCYLHLALIEEKEIKKVKEEEGINNYIQKDDYARREFFLHDYERIEHIQRKLDVKDLLIECKQTPKRIYIEGAAGAGKSTISRYIAYQWARNKKPWKGQYELMFYIKLRELNSGKYTENNSSSLIKVIKQECYQLGHGNGLSKEEIILLERYMGLNPGKVLFVLDGLDELQLTTNYITHLWQSLVNSNYDLLVTSRPGIQQKRKNIKINLNLAVLGFSDEQVEKYIKDFFKPKYTPSANPQDAQGCVTDIRANNNLWSLAHTPIQLELICSIWGNELKQQDLNLTNLYRLMLDKMLKRNKHLALKKQGEEVSINDIDTKPLKKEYQKYLRYMEYLAFLGMSKKAIILQTQEMEEAYRVLSSAKEGSVYFYDQLKALGLLKRYDNGNKAEFAHLTFQEFFAAKYIKRAIKAFCEDKIEGLNHETLYKFIKRTKWDSFFEIMWTFVAGMLAGKTDKNQYFEYYYQYQANEKNIELKLPKLQIRLQRLQTFFDLLLQEPRNIVRFEEIFLLVRCLEEARMPAIMQKETIIFHLNEWFNFYCHYMDKYGLYKTNLSRIINIIQNSLFINREIAQKLEKILIGFDSEDKKFKAINDWFAISSSRALNCSVLREIFVNPSFNENIKLELLEKIGEFETLTDKICNILNEVIYDENQEPQIRIEAFKILESQDLESEVSKACDFLINVLQSQNRDSQSRISASKILINLENLPEKIIKSLLNVLCDEEELKNFKIELLNIMYDLDEMPEGLRNFLLTILQDENLDGEIKFEIMKLFLHLDDAPSEVVDFAINFLEEKHEDTNLKIKLLGLFIDLSSIPNKFLTKLVKNLHGAKNWNNNLNLKIVNFFAEVENLPSVLIDKLIKLLNDKDENVEFKVELVNIFYGRKKMPENIKSMLQGILKDKKHIRKFRKMAFKILIDLHHLSSSTIDVIRNIILDNAELISFRIQILKKLFPTHKISEVKLKKYMELLKNTNKHQLKKDIVKSIKDNNKKYLIRSLKVLPVFAHNKFADKYEIENPEQLEKMNLTLYHFLKNVIPESATEMILNFLYKHLSDFSVQMSFIKLLEKFQFSPLKVFDLLEELNISDVALGLILSTLLWPLAYSDLKNIYLILNELYPNQPPSIPPSRLIRSARDITEVDDKGKLHTLTLCGEVMESIIKINQETHVISQDFWTISIVRRREGARSNNSYPNFFKPVKKFTNGLFDHAFIIIEGVNQSIRFAKKIDLYAEKSKSSQCSGQRIRIEITDMDDFNRLGKLAENCSCMMQGISRQKAGQLEETIKRDQAAAERGEIIYNIQGDGSFSKSSRHKKEHNCISWCLEKWQEIGLPLQRKWYDAIVVVPKAYLPQPESAESNNESSCRLM